MSQSMSKAEELIEQAVEESLDERIGDPVRIHIDPFTFRNNVSWKIGRGGGGTKTGSGGLLSTVDSEGSALQSDAVSKMLKYGIYLVIDKHGNITCSQ